MANGDHAQRMGALSARSVSKRYGGVVALDEASLTIRSGSVSGLIGPNGAGKSTMVGIVTGFIRPDSGAIYFEDQDVTHLKVAKRNQIGIARTFQQATPLVGLSVLDNVLVGMTERYRGGTLGVIFPIGDLRSQEQQQRQQAYHILQEFGLGDRANSDAADLPFGQLRFLEIARAMATKPSILLLDEPAAGLNRLEITMLSRLIGDFASRGIGVLVIDHDMPFVFGSCAQITVMDYGRIIAEGCAEDIKNDRAVRAAYLSTESISARVLH